MSDDDEFGDFEAAVTDVQPVASCTVISNDGSVEKDVAEPSVSPTELVSPAGGAVDELAVFGDPSGGDVVGSSRVSHL
jgi:hypothetical protein